MTDNFEHIVITTEDPDGPVGRELIRHLSAEMAARYPEDPLEGGAGYDPAQALSVPGATFLVAWADGQAVGCGAIRPLAPGLGELKRMFVAPEARRRGVASLLLASLEEFSRASGYERLCLQTALRQPEAMGLYEGAGYERITCYGEYADDPLSVCYGKSLAAI